MEPAEAPEVTQLLQAVVAGARSDGDNRGDREVADRLMEVVHDELHRQAASYIARESPNHSLQPTLLVNEAYLKLIQLDRTDWKGRTHFFAVGAQAMRRILVDHARRNQRLKHGGGIQRVTLDEGVALSPQRDEDLLAVDAALEKLAKIDERQARIVELRFFAGLSVEEVAEALGVSKRTVEADWTLVRAWLRRELAEGDEA